MNLSTSVESYSFLLSLPPCRVLFPERLKAASTVYQEQSAQPSDRLVCLFVLYGSNERERRRGDKSEKRRESAVI